MLLTLIPVNHEHICIIYQFEASNATYCASGCMADAPYAALHTLQSHMPLCFVRIPEMNSHCLQSSCILAPAKNCCLPFSAPASINAVVHVLDAVPRARARPGRVAGLKVVAGIRFSSSICKGVLGSQQTSSGSLGKLVRDVPVMRMKLQSSLQAFVYVEAVHQRISESDMDNIATYEADLWLPSAHWQRILALWQAVAAKEARSSTLSGYLHTPLRPAALLHAFGQSPSPFGFVTSHLAHCWKPGCVVSTRCAKQQLVYLCVSAARFSFCGSTV